MTMTIISLCCAVVDAVMKLPFLVPETFLIFIREDVVVKDVDILSSRYKEDPASEAAAAVKINRCPFVWCYFSGAYEGWATM